MLQAQRPGSIKRMNAMLSASKLQRSKVTPTGAQHCMIGGEMTLNWEDLDEYDAACVFTALNSSGALPVITKADIDNPPKTLKQAMCEGLPQGSSAWIRVGVFKELAWWSPTWRAQGGLQQGVWRLWKQRVSLKGAKKPRISSPSTLYSLWVLIIFKAKAKHLAAPWI